ncbi:hypothetical protein MKW92_036115, partial [Papaver armeniacum]
MAKKKSGVSMEVGSDGVAVIKFANPPVNALSYKIIEELKERYVEAMNRNDVKAVVLTGEGGKFCGGFDINAFAKEKKTEDNSDKPDEQSLVNTIE